MNKPNFFIIGAPKCGTTALALYLSEHPQIGFSIPKEPFYWSTDYPILRKLNRLSNIKDYFKLFDHINEGISTIGEGSTNYLNSKVAVSNILKFNKNSLFIVMLRNPVEVVQSFHQELLYSLDEDQINFETVWRLQDARRKGLSIPKKCTAPQFLQYKKVASYEDQLKRLFALVPEKQRMVILFDDFTSHTKSVYCEALNFLGVDYDGRNDFPPINQSRTHRILCLTNLVLRPPKLLNGPIQYLRQVARKRKAGLIPWIKEGLKTPSSKEVLQESFYNEVKEYFYSDIIKVSKLINRDLSNWL